LKSLAAELTQFKTGFEEFEGQWQTFRSKLEFPLMRYDSLDGIISHLTKKHGGNVLEKGIVRITAKSVWSAEPTDRPTNVADLTSYPFLSSLGELRHWIWDFGGRLEQRGQLVIVSRAGLANHSLRCVPSGRALFHPVKPDRLQKQW
jgi:hypothetical protein